MLPICRVLPLWVVGAGWLLAGGAATETALAQSPDGGDAVTFETMTVGFGGVYKVGLWTPVTVELRGGSQAVSGRLLLETPDVDDVMAQVISPEEIVLGAGEAAAVQLFVRFGAVESQLRATFVPSTAGVRPVSRQWSHNQGGGQRLPAAVASHREMVLGIGPDLGLGEVAALHRAPDGVSQLAIAQAATGEGLPQAWFGYEGVDWVVVTTSDPRVLQSLDQRVLAALTQWVELGGRLLICAGERAEQALGEGGPFAALSPGIWTNDAAALRRTSELESYLGDTVEPIQLSSGGLSVPLLGLKRGRIEIQQANAPLVFRAAHGFGEVVLVAIDLDRPPLADWPTRARFVSKLIGRAARGTREGGRDAMSRITHSGVTDLTGQLRVALDQYPGVAYVPFVVVALGILVYILLIGPGDYLFVRRVLGRMPSTWVTFPLLVAIGSAGAYALSHSSKANRIQANQVTLVDFDVNSGRVRGVTWADVFSPAMTRYDVTLHPRQANGEPAANAQTLVAWLGAPGRVLGGMDRASSATASYGSYRFTPELDAMEGVPIPIWASKSFVGRWHGEDTPAIRVNLRASVAGVPEGTITSLLDVPLKNCLLAYGRWAFSLADLQPGETIRIDNRSVHRELRDELTGRRTERDETSNKIRDYRREYDEQSVDIPSILQQMMFYEAAGGLSYTGLYHRYQPFTDLSRQLALDRGVLLGFVDQAGADLVVTPEGADPWDDARRWTCFRFVFDVEN